jgi:hypothetical protein
MAGVTTSVQLESNDRFWSVRAPIGWPLPERDAQALRLRTVFELSRIDPLPRVTRDTLRKYLGYLKARAAMPFEALCADTRVPLMQLVHYIRITDLLEADDHVSEGLLCAVQDLPMVQHLPLADIGVLEESPNYQLIDDYAYWFINYQ